jgi:uncharacterized protein YegP (UPF0339 family)
MEFLVGLDDDGLWHWELRGSDGIVLLEKKGYASRSQAEAAVEQVREAARRPIVFEPKDR